MASPHRTAFRTALLALGLAVLTGCGNYAGELTEPAEPHPVDPGDPHGGGEVVERSGEELFTALQPTLAFCRTCHVPGGVADTEEGRDFMLSADPDEDYGRMHASWLALGEGVDNSPILLKASGAETHSGGAPWPPESAAYRATRALLACWDDPASCDGSVVEEVPPLLPLLGSARGGHAWVDFCAGKPSDTALPADPRSLVQPGANAGKAVYFNAFWKDCHLDPDGNGLADEVGEYAHPKTCGEYLESATRGAVIMGAIPMEKAGGGFHTYRDGEIIRPGSTFAGDHPYGFGAVTGEQFNSLWIAWGYPGRPDNFDELVAERYGFGPPSADLPYPLIDEDPNATDGGSGRLPEGLIQTRREDGSWSGEISTNCQGCHSTTVNGETIYGGGGSLLDATVISRDYMFFGSAIGVAIDRLGLAGRVRGTNNAQFSNITALSGIQSEEQFYDVMSNGSTGTGDTPAWWNVGRRPVKFVDAMFPGDAVRVDFALFQPLLVNKYGFAGPDGEFRSPAPDNAWISAHVQDGDNYITSRKAPVYPLPIDTALAEQGAVLFHGKDLWARDEDGVPTNGNPVDIALLTDRGYTGNGSCASCHGAYSPRYVNDPAYLQDPALEGIASYVVPLAAIGTDPVRSDTYNAGTNEANNNSSIAYPETAGTAQDCGVQNLPGMQTDAEGRERPIGYAAPPLYGVWATAPFLHNGSVPDAWSLLKSSDRPAIWRRVSKQARADQAALVVMGYETDMDQGYDAERLGWKFDALDAAPVPEPQFWLSELYGQVLISWNITNPPTLSNADVEKRKIYDTSLFSQGNGGHTFSDVLTDAERRAIIEYLKTL